MSSPISGKIVADHFHHPKRVPNDPPTRAQGTSEQSVFRISGIPLSWTEDDVLNALKSTDASGTFEVQNCHITLYPACYGSFQTGLFNTDSSLESFGAINGDGVRLELSIQDTVLDLFIDRHFYDLTPLNTPENDVFAE
jgi:hypothetical protein